MNTPEPAQQIVPVKAKLTPSAMLGHFIDLVIHPNPHTRALLEEMIEPTIGIHGADGRIVEFAARAAKANVAQSLALKMVSAIIKAEGWIYSSAMARTMVDFVYRNHLKNQDEERRSKENASAAEGSSNDGAKTTSAELS